MSNHPAQSQQPICIDLDGTLIKTDSLIESLFVYIKKNPINILKCIAWLFLGKAEFKSKIARDVQLDAGLLPYHEDLLQFLDKEFPDSSKHLCTAANISIAKSVADHLGRFDSVIASTDEINMKGENKADELVRRFGEKGFVYAGNEKSDLSIWRRSSAAIVVSNSSRLVKQVEAVTGVTKVFDSEKRGFSKYLAAIRMYQWVKNILMILPLILAHKFFDIQSYINITIGFFAFGLVASATYILNDLMDLDADRLHESKRHRPFAAGDLPIITGLMLSPILLAAGLYLAWLVSVEFLLFILLYLGITLVYSYIAKSIAIIDVLMLAILYTIRLMAGAVAIHEPITFWLLAYSMFIFFSLANVKRYTEIIRLNRKQQISGRGYTSDDASFVKVLGISSGLMSVLIFALYINDPGIISKYSHPAWLWAITPMLLYWITRVWHLTYHGKMSSDPVIFAIKDSVSYVVAGLTILGIYLAI